VMAHRLLKSAFLEYERFMASTAEVQSAATPSVPKMSSESSDVHPGLPECAICLGTSDQGIKLMLSCGHSYCQSCISQYVESESHHQRKTCCPLCKKELLDREIAVCHEFLSSQAPQLVAAIEGRSSSSTHHAGQGQVGADDPEDLLCRCTFEQMAHNEDMKCCPSCGALIEKNGGCDHMTCRCGYSFNWSRVPLLATSMRCNCVHPHPRYGVWGTTCSNSTLSAKAKLMARRGGLVTAAVSTAAAGSVLVGGALLTAGGVFAVKTVVESTVAKVRSAFESPVTKAQRAVEQAELEVEREEQKWFNWAAIANARKSLKAKRVLLAKAQEDNSQAVDSGCMAGVTLSWSN